ncbi:MULTISPECIES: MerR family transcriptional regulator [Sodalis]|uniref:DNA-binding transcriptional MerR regulator n=1 Tax=Sodalis ligni TaxID=2697027 RepID=A0A4R1N4Y5_9GAMM|nr:MerR family transcriptional regulator [Sodalis ligni]TCL02143.1 DNA-binding transcriptional MerR regulator [Sodalis ligni]
MTTLIYSIHEFAALSGITEYNLRYFDKIGLLPAQRDTNGYRVYHQRQIASAQMVVTLQNARLSNAQIKTLLKDYTSRHSLAMLKQTQQQLTAYIHTLHNAQTFIACQISQLETIHIINNQLDTPFTEEKKSELVGVISLETQHIGDFFQRASEFNAPPNWYLHHRYGFLLAEKDIQSKSYPLDKFYCTEPSIIDHRSQYLSAGRYISQYCSGSLENNQKVWSFVQHIRQNGYRIQGDILIENVSGPAVQTKKSDFLIKIMVPIN